MYIYIVAPGNTATGGVEALHQLADAITKLNIFTYVLYKKPVQKAITSDFALRYKFNVAPSEVHSDIKKSSVLILPEGEDPQKWRDENWGAIVIWWLSALCKFPTKNYRGCFHIFQSEYARATLANLGFIGLMVTDYIRDDIINLSGSSEFKTGKRSGVIVNHRSAGVAARWKQDGWKESVTLLSGISAVDCFKIYLKHNIFIDVGWHPGRDRMAREAALAGCIVFVNRRGAAGNEIDMPLSNLLRIDETRPNECWEKMEKSLNNNEVKKEMHIYREWVLRQKAEFFKEVKVLSDALETFSKGNFCSETMIQNDKVDISQYCAIQGAEIEYLRNSVSDLGIRLMHRTGGFSLQIFLLKIKNLASRYLPF